MSKIKGTENKDDTDKEVFMCTVEENPFEKGFSSNSFPKTLNLKTSP